MLSILRRVNWKTILHPEAKNYLLFSSDKDNKSGNKPGNDESKETHHKNELKKPENDESKETHHKNELKKPENDESKETHHKNEMKIMLLEF